MDKIKGAFFENLPVFQRALYRCLIITIIIIIIIIIIIKVKSRSWFLGGRAGGGGVRRRGHKISLGRCVSPMPSIPEPTHKNSSFLYLV